LVDLFTHSRNVTHWLPAVSDIEIRGPDPEHEFPVVVFKNADGWVRFSGLVLGICRNALKILSSLSSRIVRWWYRQQRMQTSLYSGGKIRM
jgi:hypothetical protein